MKKMSVHTFKKLGNILSSTRTQIAFFLEKNVQKMGLELKNFFFISSVEFGRRSVPLVPRSTPLWTNSAEEIKKKF